ncbi:hypothetical protein BD410DRAFT_295369 [Rickenella mellea]|uniref:Uncharacterized protein n=1 Tax=Rickenella mellea TaxID=50990 RepID=A0A4Y7Q2J6_9AGAM|nr:hypothetical protein BD410DRAFT_295369 [Rickenella mellea]
MLHFAFEFLLVSRLPGESILCMPMPASVALRWPKRSARRRLDRYSRSNPDVVSVLQHAYSFLTESSEEQTRTRELERCKQRCGGIDT